MLSCTGIDRIRTKSKRQPTLLIDRALQYGFGIASPMNPEGRGGTVTLSVPHAHAVACELLRRDIVVDFRKGAGIRLSPHFYNSDEEVLYAVDEIKQILDGKAYRRHLKDRTVVT